MITASRGSDVRDGICHSSARLRGEEGGGRGGGRGGRRIHRFGKMRGKKRGEEEKDEEVFGRPRGGM